MNKIFTTIFMLLFISISYGAEFSLISMKNWSKEVISDDHLRFTSPLHKEFIIHLQVDSFDKEQLWNNKTLQADITEMARTRKIMSSYLGTENYSIETFAFEEKSKERSFAKLTLNGSYLRLDKQKINFLEINFYYSEHFLQFKIISTSNLPSNEEIKSMLKEINPSDLDLK